MRTCATCKWVGPDYPPLSRECQNPRIATVSPVTGKRNNESCGYQRGHWAGRCTGGWRWTHPQGNVVTRAIRWLLVKATR